MEQVVVGHRTATTAEHFADRVHDLFAAFERNVHHLGERRARDVVLGGAQPSAHNDGVAAGEGRSKSQHNSLVIVTHVLVKVRGDSIRGQLLAQPLRVGVGDLPEQQLCTDRNYFNSHSPRPSCRQRSSAIRCRSS